MFKAKNKLTFIQKLPLFAGALFKKQTPTLAKALILLTGAYVLSPIDLLPGFLGPLGLVDDALIIPFMVNWVLRLLPNDQVDYDSPIPIN